MIQVITAWPGANPVEIEREIVEEQEEVLRALEGLVAMKSTSAASLASVTLEFRPGTDLDAAMLRVNNKLGEVPSYPAEALKPVLTPAGAQESIVGWFILIPEEGRDDIVPAEMLEFVEDTVEATFERIPGVAAANILGGQEREVLIEVDPERLAQRGITLREVADRLAAEDRDVSAGHLDEGKRRFVIRTVGAFLGDQGLGDVILRDDPKERVFLRDVASIRIDFEDATDVVRHKGVPCLALNAQRRTGANVLRVMNDLHKAVKELNEGPLKKAGLHLEVAYDTSIYIRDALELVQNNLAVGGLLAILVLLFFLRAVAPTVIISIAIPVSAVGTFLAMYMLGRNINVVSLAGLSFAIGMLVDNSIVVLENIYRHAQEGADEVAAASRGTTEVWGAVLASTLTTVAVFLPLLFMQAEIAQLLRDIALAICCAVILSLGVSVLVIPCLASRWVDARAAAAMSDPTELGALGKAIYAICGSVPVRLAIVLGLTGASLLGTWFLAPKTEYLPAGNQNFLFAFLVPPSGYNVEEFGRIAQRIEGELAPMWSGEDPLISNFFYVTFAGNVVMGAQASRQERLAELKGPFQGALNKIPGMIAFVTQPGIFDQGLAGGRQIDLELQGPELQRIMEIAGQAFFGVMQGLEGAQPRPDPGLELGQPELRVIPNRARLAEVGLTSGDLGFMVDVLADGAKISEVRLPDGKEVDMTLRGTKKRLGRTQDLEGLPVHTPRAGVLPLQALAEIVTTRGPDKILHSERARTVFLRIVPHPDMPLETAMNKLEDEILKPMVDRGAFEGGYQYRMAGTADKLTSTRQELKGLFLTALAVSFLLMASLFESFLYPLVIMFTVPFAGLGGFVALKLQNELIAPQPMDVLTMLGFILLLGVVVNNAILLVDRALRNIRDHGDEPRAAVAEAVNARVRPIFMSTLTSVFGMLPLVSMTGPGSELYRGIGSVVVGGLLLSTVFTLVLTPTLLSLVLELRLRLSPDRPL